MEAGTDSNFAPRLVCAIITIVLPFFAAPSFAKEYGLLTSVPVGPFLNGVLPRETPNDPGTATWGIIPAFPKLQFDGISVIVSNPGTNRLYVGSLDGEIRHFENRSDAEESETFLDIRDRVSVRADSGFLGIAFHPEFGEPKSRFRGDVYVYYTSHCPLNTPKEAVDLDACFNSYPRGYVPGFSRTYLRLSRFRVPGGASAADPGSERVLLNIRQYSGRHAGGGLTFGNDGYLYLAIGDQFRVETAQEIVDTLEGGTLRLSVDVSDIGNLSWACLSGTHMPRRRFDTADEVSGRFYCIPDDNPWVDASGAAFEEYFSIGQRNPYRLSKDPVSGRLWSGEVGASSREEINIVEKGNNYGWPFREGRIAGIRPEPAEIVGTLTDPVIDLVREESHAIIGGYVYRGSKFPELVGRYLAGDYDTNTIWAMTLDETTMTATKQELTAFTPGKLGTWGIDRNGEVYLGSVVGRNTLYTLAKVGDSSARIPEWLSELGAFDDLVNLKPNAALIPYQLNQPFWSDGALKRRWVAVPNDGLRDTPEEVIGFSRTEDWSYPAGTVLIKHFELPLDESNAQKTVRLETRFLVHGVDKRWYGLTYRWLPSQLDARLLTTGETESYSIRLASGGKRKQVWEFPARDQCFRCHQDVVGGALGPRTHQLNGDFKYPTTNRSDNQLRTWNYLGLFSPAVKDRMIRNSPRSRNIGDADASLEVRARSYLDANCAYCHRPETRNRAGFDARYTTPLEDQNLLGGDVLEDLGIADVALIVPGKPERSMIKHRMGLLRSSAMPPLAKNKIDELGVGIVSSWIKHLAPGRTTPGLYRPVRSSFRLWNKHGRLNAAISFDFAGGGEAWQPMAGDWDGDSIETVGLFNAKTGRLRIVNNNSGGAPFISYRYGRKAKDMISLAGDWNGDGVDTAAFYDPAKGRFYLDHGNGEGKSGRAALGSGFRYGPKKTQWIPLAGDWDGDHIDTVGLYDPIMGRFRLRNSNDKGPSEIDFRFGKANAGWLPISGDWNADNRDGVGLYDPRRNTFHLRNELSEGPAEWSYRVKGLKGSERPIAGDWDGTEGP